jgi:hypothetical protein
MGDLVPRDPYDPAPASRQARRQVAHIQEQGQVRDAALVARTWGELAQVVAEEQVAYARAQQRISGGYDLADHTVSRATHLNQKVNQASRDNPGLELTLRDIEYKAALGAGMIVYDYMTRR